MFTTGFHLDEQLWNRNEREGVYSHILACGPGLLVMEWRFAHSGSVTPVHSHHHEQVTYVKQGATEVTFADGSRQIYQAGEAIYFAPNEEHGLVTLCDDTVCIDAFSPVRLDHLSRHTEHA